MDKGIKTFTKRWLTIIMIFAIIDMQLTYVLAFLGKENIAEVLSQSIAIEIVAVFLIYCAKSFLGTKEAEKIKLKEKELGIKEDEDEEEVDE